MENRITLSLCMIVKNEVGKLRQCVESAYGLFDELVIVDTGSTDGTAHLAQELGASVYNYEWHNDFGAARNFAFSKATKDYIMWLDADEVLPSATRSALISLKEECFRCSPAVNMYTMMCHADGSSQGLRFKRNRIVERSCGYTWIGFIHEYINVPPQLALDTELEIHHLHRMGTDPQRNLKYYEEVVNKNVPLSSRDMYYYAKELYYNGMWAKAVPRFRDFLEGDVWVEERLDALCKLAECQVKLGNIKGAKKTLFTSLDIEPRAELLYQLGLIYQNSGNFSTAIYIYENILRLQMPQTLGFTYLDAWEFNPRLQLVVCYYQVGKRDLAYFNHLMTHYLKPTHPSVLFNAEFFKNLGGNDNE